MGTQVPSRNRDRAGPVDEEIEDDAWSILEQHADKSWSHVDATSFALMAREGVDEAFSLDPNFAQRGLRVLPSPS